MIKITTTRNYKGVDYKLLWVPDFKVTEETKSVITQVSGIIFDSEGNILITRSSPTSDWGIPGGHPEEGETIEKTLAREILEEVSLELANVKLLGAVQISELNDPTVKPYYQIRMFAIVAKVLPLQVDIATNKIYERMFVPFIDLPKYVSWGDVGTAVFEAGHKISNELRK